jgi:V/A-type H+-transporting ATPase subunit I
MILKMKRYSFLVYHKQYTEFLEKIKETGVLHVIEKAEGIAENDALREKMQLAARFKNALKQLEKRTPKNADLLEIDNEKEGLQLLSKIELALSEKEALEQKLQNTEKECERMEVWGTFSHERLTQLKNAGFVVNFYSCNLRKFDQEWEVLYNAFEIDTTSTTRYFITITRPNQVIEIDADPIKLSSKTAEQLLEDISLIREKIESQNALLEKMSVEDYNSLKSAQSNLIEQIDYSKVVLNTHSEAENHVMVLEGWCPEESEDILNNYLESTGVYYETAIPTEEDKVPIKLKNNKFTKLYEMIGELYDLPNYHELDLTPFFAPFYMLFFGLCLGDVGYGLIFVIAAIIFRKKVSDTLKPVFSLVALLGISTVIMGAIGGNIFGYSLIDAKIEWLESYKKYMMDSNKLFNVALILGVIQIIFGMIIKAIGTVRRYGVAASLSTWGWLIIIIGCGGTYASNMFFEMNASTIQYLYYGFGGVGGLMVFLLNDIKRNPFINIGAGLWDAYNMILGVIGDVLSYIRLFALGISGAVMGFVFNDLAINLSGNIPVLSPIIMIIILLIGHGLNIFMSSLSAFVHPMRLTFVEFYKNAGFEGGGKKYRPYAAYKEEKTLF